MSNWTVNELVYEPKKLPKDYIVTIYDSDSDDFKNMEDITKNNYDKTVHIC